MSQLHCQVGLVLTSLLIGASSAAACMWDYDTLKQERARFPGTLEIITGKFLRHSKEFYEWRIQDRLKKIAADPKDQGLYDDLAVAYEKTGQNTKAIETMLKVEEFAPGRYETYSNLATFYFLGGDFQKALEFVDRALVINPNAHFGREKYQKWLTEYVIERSKNQKITFPLRMSPRPYGEEEDYWSNSFCMFIAGKIDPTKNKQLDKSDYQAAVTGILGMMRFAYHDSPVLLEVLGDVLSAANFHAPPDIDAKRLAARAYLRASYLSNDDRAKAAYRKLAEQALGMQTRGPGDPVELHLDELEMEFQHELADASRWYSELHSNEIAWINDGSNPEVEFDRLYTEEPRIPAEISRDLTLFEGISIWFRYWEHRALIGVLFIGLLGIGLFLRRRRRRSLRARSTKLHR